MEHVWAPHPKDPAKYIMLNGKDDCLVRVIPTPERGYLWQHRKQYGFAATLAEAKDWVETAAEFYPRKLPT